MNGGKFAPSYIIPIMVITAVLQGPQVVKLHPQQRVFGDVCWLDSTLAICTAEPSADAACYIPTIRAGGRSFSKWCFPKIKVKGLGFRV